MTRKTPAGSKVDVKLAMDAANSGLSPKRLKELLHAAEREAKAAGRERQARRMARMLAHVLGIPPNGIDLVCWIGEDTCRTNVEAVSRWIEVQLCDAEFQFEALHTPEIDLLAQRLNRSLIMIEASRPW